jgi:hypothetical protein
MKTIKTILVAGAVIVSAAGYAQTVPATEQKPTTPQSQTQQPPATQQNSETFSKPESERTLNPVAVPLPQGAAIKDTIVPGKSKNDTKYKRDTSKAPMQKGSGELDTTGKSGMQKKRKN